MVVGPVGPTSTGLPEPLYPTKDSNSVTKRLSERVPWLRMQWELIVRELRDRCRPKERDYL